MIGPNILQKMLEFIQHKLNGNPHEKSHEFPQWWMDTAAATKPPGVFIQDDDANSDVPSRCS